MVALSNTIREQTFFSRFQLYAGAYVIIWTLRPCIFMTVFLRRQQNLDRTTERTTERTTDRIADRTADRTTDRIKEKNSKLKIENSKLILLSKLH